MPEGPPRVRATPEAGARLHPVNRHHLDVLTGELGILQHALGPAPDPDHGYCVDDVARGLEVDLLHARVVPWAVVAESASRNMRYLEDAFDESVGRFRNFRAIDGSWAPGLGSNDSFGRAMLALASCAAADVPEPDIARRAEALFDRALPKSARVTSIRAAAAIVLACATAPTQPRVDLMRTMATELHARFRSFARPGWPWPETEMTYENAILPRALIVAGDRLGATTMVRVGLQVLDWLIEMQTAPEGHLSPIGNGWWSYGGTKSRFDQQPIEATSLLLACEAASAVTGRQRYANAMERAYEWFLGANDLGVRVAQPARGACRDGLTPTGVNTNEGAESTLMWLMAVEHIRAKRAGDGLGPSASRPPKGTRPASTAIALGAARASGSATPT